jgi:hypothetical protein
MRAREFTINIPINIKINGDGEPEIEIEKDDSNDDPANPATNFVPPLQQKIELMKNAAGKQSDVIRQITADDDNEAS